MLGRVLNTHQQWICRKLADSGRVVTRQVAVEDEANAIRDAVAEALERADLIITTGGLGPTSDDITRDLVAQLLGLELREDASALANIEGFFRQRGRPMPPSTRIQAMVPEGGDVIHNAHGTAPGLAIPIHPSRAKAASGPQWLVMLPGPPRELRPMFEKQILPFIEKHYPNNESFVSLTLRTTGMGESLVEERIAPELRELLNRGLGIGYCARTGEVDVRLVSKGSDGQKLVQEAALICRKLLAPHVYGEGDELIETELVRELIRQRQSVSVAESCTGGLVGHRITNVPGSSEVFHGGVVAYHNDVKVSTLGVPESVLATEGAVSEACARAMADGVRRLLKSDWAISVTGIAGPGGGSTEKPVGLAYIGVASAKETRAVRVMNPFDRETFKHSTSQQALDLLRRAISAQSSAGNG